MTFHDRICEPADTVARMMPLLFDFGITRVARQTDLDILGIPVFAAIRPNAKNLSSSQGKGLTDDAAKASAIMEAVEYAVAEDPRVDRFVASATSLSAQSKFIFSPERHLAPLARFDRSAEITWVHGRGLITQRPFAVPLDLVSLGGHAPDFPGICQTTNGLASGNTLDEAIFHGLCELIERDAYTLWMLRPLEERLQTAINPVEMRDGHVNRLYARMKDAGLYVALYDQTTDVGIPVVMAIVGRSGGYARKFEIAAGYGAHPSLARAAIRALTEAAQTRVTSIAAARDDITESDFNEGIAPEIEALLTPLQYRPLPAEFLEGGSDKTGVRMLARRMMTANLSEPVVVLLGSARSQYSVVRVLSSDLEDGEANLHWRPGHRAEMMLSR